MKRPFLVFGALLFLTLFAAFIYGCGTLPPGSTGVVPRIFFIHCEDSWSTPEGVSANLAGGDMQTIVPNRGAGVSLTHISQSPDGSKVFLLSSMSGNATLEVMNPDGSGAQMLASASNLQAPSWSRDSQKVAWLFPPIQLNIRTLGGTTVQVTTESSCSQPSLSKSATYIAYGRSGDIWYRNADGTGGEHPVTSNTSQEGMPTFSPDDENALVFYRLVGSEVYMCKVNILNTPEVVTLNEGQPFVEIVTVPSGGILWSAKAPSYIYIVAKMSGDSYDRIYRLPVSGGTPVAMVEDSCYSADMREFKGVDAIFYARTPGSYPDIYRMTYDGTLQTRVTSNESAGDWFNSYFQE